MVIGAKIKEKMMRPLKSLVALAVLSVAATAANAALYNFTGNITAVRLSEGVNR